MISTASTQTTLSVTQLERSVGAEVNFHSSLHAIIISLVTILGGYLELQYQSRKKSPLEEHRNIMAAIYVNLFMYGMGLMMEFKLKDCFGPRYLSIVKGITPLFGILTVVLILIILYPVLGLIAFIIWALITIEVVIKLFEEIIQWLRPVFTHARGILTSYFNREENGSPETAENGSPDTQENESPV